MPEGEITAGIDFKGFYLSTKNVNIPSDCKRIKDYLIKLTILISKKKQWQNYKNKCSHMTDKMFQTILHSFSHQSNKEDFYKYLKRNFLNNSQIKTILAIYEKKISKNRNKLSLLLNKVILSTLKKQKKTTIYKENILFLNELKNEPDGLIKEFIIAIIALRGNNIVWAKEKIRTILSQHPLEHIFSSGQIRLNNDHGFKRFKNDLLKGLLYIKKNLPDETLTKLFFSYMQNFLKDQQYTTLRIKTQANWSLSQIRTIVKSHYYGRKYPALWYLILNKRTYGGEDIQFLNDFLSKKNIDQGSASLLWIYSHYFPTDTKLQNLIFEQIEKTVLSKNHYHRYILLELLEKNEIIGQRLKKKYKKFRGPLFKLKRKFYRKMLGQGEMIHLSLYQLAKLGDRDQNLLWWIAL